MKKPGNILFIMPILFLIIANCSHSPTNVAGGSDESGNAMTRITGRAIYETGKPAVSADVFLRPRNFLADTINVSHKEFASGVKSTRTDAAGLFSIDSVDTGKYAIEVNDRISNAAFLQCSVLTVQNKMDLSSVTLNLTGSLTGTLSTFGIDDTSLSAYIAIEGLDRIVKTDSLGSFNFNNLPPGNFQFKLIPSIPHYDIADNFTHEIKSGKTDTMGTKFVLPEISRTGMRITAVIRDSSMDTAAIRANIILVFVRKPDVLIWNSEVTPFNLTADQITSTTFSPDPLNMAMSEQAVIIKKDSMDYEITWPAFTVSHGLDGVYIMAVINRTGNILKFASLLFITEARSNAKLGNINPWAVILQP